MAKQHLFENSWVSDIGLDYDIVKQCHTTIKNDHFIFTPFQNATIPLILIATSLGSA